MKTPEKTTAKRRRSISAIAGGVFLSRQDLAQRWGLTERTIIKKEKDGLLVPVKIGNGQVIRYALNDVVRIELEARGRTK